MQTRMKGGAWVSALVLLAVGAASGTEPPPLVTFYPDGNHEDTLPANVTIIARPYRDRQIASEAISLVEGGGIPVPIDVTPGFDARGAVLVKPRAPLAPGDYILDASEGSQLVSIRREADTEPPSAITELHAEVDPRADTMGFEFFPPQDSGTPARWLSYDIYTAPSPEDPDTEGTPVLAGELASARLSGRVHLNMWRGENCGAAFPADAIGKYNVRVRARDAAGNLGPASPPVEADVRLFQRCGKGEGGCSALPAPALLPAVAGVLLWLSRRRRA